MALRRQQRSKRPGKVLLFLFFFLLIGAGGGAFFLFFEGTPPTIDLNEVPQNLGKTDTLHIQVNDTGSGLRFVEVTATQGALSKQLYAKTNPRVRQTGQIGPLQDNLSLSFDAKALGFKDGDITLSATAFDFSLRGLLQGNSTSVQTTLTLDTEPPKIRIIHSENYISPGGTGIVIYTVSENDSVHGATVNGKFNQGHPVGDSRKDTYIAYFGLPYFAQSIDQSFITAEDVSGNITKVPFSTIFKSVTQKQDRINISDNFLSTKIPEFEQYHPNLPGNQVEKYLYTNRNLRKENNKKIAELCSKPYSKRLWEGRFIRMAGSGRAEFADHRTYYYKNQPIDQQVHLGMDIASTKRAKVKAANNGKVVFADYLGIYGNMVLLDHGQGIFSLYSHLSQINVALDDMVSTGEVLGLTGTSGMAGGDHLHFSMLVNGVFTTPKEWWDPHWIEVTIDDPLVNSKF